MFWFDLLLEARAEVKIFAFIFWKTLKFAFEINWPLDLDWWQYALRFHYLWSKLVNIIIINVVEIKRCYNRVLNSKNSRQNHQNWPRSEIDERKVIKIRWYFVTFWGHSMTAWSRRGGRWSKKISILDHVQG